jgi:hypothetical protein
LRLYLVARNLTFNQIINRYLAPLFEKRPDKRSCATSDPIGISLKESHTL